MRRLSLARQLLWTAVSIALAKERKAERTGRGSSKELDLLVEGSLLCALPKLFRGRTEFSFERGYTNRDWFRFRNEVQHFDPVSETVTKNVHTNCDAGSRFDGRKNAGQAVMFLHDARLLFHLRKDDREIIIVFRIVFAGEAQSTVRPQPR